MRSTLHSRASLCLAGSARQLRARPRVVCPLGGTSNLPILLALIGRAPSHPATGRWLNSSGSVHPGRFLRRIRRHARSRSAGHARYRIPPPDLVRAADSFGKSHCTFSEKDCGADGLRPVRSGSGEDAIADREPDRISGGGRPRGGWGHLVIPSGSLAIAGRRRSSSHLARLRSGLAAATSEAATPTPRWAPPAGVEKRVTPHAVRGLYLQITHAAISPQIIHPTCKRSYLLRVGPHATAGDCPTASSPSLKGAIASIPGGPPQECS
jgi:hypothetical protein